MRGIGVERRHKPSGRLAGGRKRAPHRHVSRLGAARALLRAPRKQVTGRQDPCHQDDDAAQDLGWPWNRSLQHRAKMILMPK